MAPQPRFDTTTQPGADTLLIIPCCAEKLAGGVRHPVGVDPFCEELSESTYTVVHDTRREILDTVKTHDRYLMGKYAKNSSIKQGTDFGGDSDHGLYMPAIDRYSGNLYSGIKGFSRYVKEVLDQPASARILILSALYGPLHPMSQIQDYNLKMSDSPARKAWMRAFPIFLSDYVSRSNICHIRLYVGSTTAYFSVAESAIKPLIQSDAIQSAIQYDVEHGNAYHTPYNHGLKLMEDLGLVADFRYTRNVNVRSLVGE